MDGLAREQMILFFAKSSWCSCSGACASEAIFLSDTLPPRCSINTPTRSSSRLIGTSAWFRKHKQAWPKPTAAAATQPPPPELLFTPLAMGHGVSNLPGSTLCRCFPTRDLLPAPPPDLLPPRTRLKLPFRRGGKPCSAIALTREAGTPGTPVLPLLQPRSKRERTQESWLQAGPSMVAARTRWRWTTRWGGWWNGGTSCLRRGCTPRRTRLSRN